MPGLRRTATVAAVAILLSVFPATQASAHHGGAVSEARRRIRESRSLLRSAEARDDAVVAVLDRYESLLGRQQAALRTARTNLAHINFQITVSELRLTALGRQRRSRAAAIAARARALYEMGPVSPLQLIGEVRSLHEYVLRAGALDYIGSFDRQLLQDIARIAHEAKQTQRELASQRKRAADVADEIADRADATREIVNAKASVHRELKDQIAEYRAEIAENQRIIELIRSRAGSYSPTGAAGRLGFAWPTLGRRINSQYGPRGGGFHAGIDIECRTGDPIAASKDGRVIAAEWGGGYGLMVIIDHGGGYTTLYGHLSRIYTSDGVIVNRHQVIGACGATGHATGDHLHFEIRINGQHVNPRPYLP